MKRILLLIAAMLIATAGFSQRGGGPTSTSRSSAPSHATVRTPSASRTNASTAPSRTSAYNQRTPARNPSYGTVPSRQPSAQPTQRYNTQPSRVNPSSSSQTSKTYPDRSVSRPVQVQRQETSPSGVTRANAPNQPVQENKTIRGDGNHPHHGGNTPGHHPSPAPMHGPSYGHVHHVPHGYHPKPPMYHPIHHRPLHMYYRPYSDWVYRYIIWNNYWHYMHTIYYTDHSMVIYRFNESYSTNKLIDYIVSDGMIFSLYRDTYECKTYFAITDANDNTIARVPVGHKYKRLVADDNGVWVLTDNGKKPIYFMLIDGVLYIYECDSGR